MHLGGRTDPSVVSCSVHRCSCLWAALLLLGATLATGATGSYHGPLLRFHADGTFKIAQFTDLHYGQGSDIDAQSNQVQATMLSLEQPDLVILSGDMVSGFAWDGKKGWFESHWRRLIQPLHAAGVPYASILGNHDGEADQDRRQIIDLDIVTGGNLTLTKQGPSYLTGASNYWLDIYSPTGGEVAARVWLLDSNDRGCEHTMSGWGCVSAGTVAWVQEHAAGLPRVPSLAFIHIPLQQHLEVWNSQPTYGSKGKSVACSLVDTGVFEAFRELGIHAVYSGHDHSNDYLGTLDGVRLAYGRKTGHGSHGPRGPKGARIIQLVQGESAALSATWIREEGGGQNRQLEQLLPEDKEKQGQCSADNWFLQRLRFKTFREALIASVVGAVLLVAATAAATVALMQRRQHAQQGSRKRAEGPGSAQNEELQLLRLKDGDALQGLP